MANPDQLIEDIKDAMADPLGVIAAEPVATLPGDTFEAFEPLAVALACVHLFHRLDLDGYARNLQLCGFARRYQLVGAAQSGQVDPVYGAASRGEAVYCAYLAGDTPLTTEIIARSATGHQPDGEYEDDFVYRCIVHDLMENAETVDEVAHRRRMNAFDRARGTAESARFSVCEAFVSGRATTFWPAFEDLLNEVETERERPVAPTDDSWASLPNHLWIEGLVWIDLAARRGMPAPEREYSMCPFPARKRSDIRHNLDIFADFPLT
ncbi:MAG: hypothetical protein V3V08_05735 [Nannocystaceae bacterium]